jgi:hypothetical protein
LTAGASRFISLSSVGRAAAARKRRGKSGLHGDTVPDNVRRDCPAQAGRSQGKCHRKRTARCSRKVKAGKGEKVRQERTALPATEAAGQTPPGAKPNRDSAGEIPVLSLDQLSGLAARGGVQTSSQRNGCHVALSRASPYRTRLTGRLIKSERARRKTRRALARFAARKIPSATAAGRASSTAARAQARETPRAARRRSTSAGRAAARNSR